MRTVLVIGVGRHSMNKVNPRYQASASLKVRKDGRIRPKCGQALVLVSWRRIHFIKRQTLAKPAEELVQNNRRAGQAGEKYSVDDTRSPGRDAGAGGQRPGNRSRTVPAASCYRWPPTCSRSKGYERTTVRDLAAAIGIQSGSIFHHFKSKEEILRSVMEETIVYNTALMRAALAEAQGTARAAAGADSLRAAVDHGWHRRGHGRAGVRMALAI